MNKTNFVARITLIVLIAIVCSPTDIIADPLDNNNEQLTLIKKKHAVPFKAQINSQVIDFSGPLVVIGTGNATHLGRISVRILETVDDSSIPWIVSDIITLTAANGDQLFISAPAGEVIPDFTKGILVGGGDGSITGGSGRFEGAEGDIHVNAIIDLSTATGKLYYTGTIKY
jgi:hypothetical protein